MTKKVNKAPDTFKINPGPNNRNSHPDVP